MAAPTNALTESDMREWLLKALIHDQQRYLSGAEDSELHSDTPRWPSSHLFSIPTRTLYTWPPHLEDQRTSFGQTGPVKALAKLYWNNVMLNVPTKLFDFIPFVVHIPVAFHTTDPATNQRRIERLMGDGELRGLVSLLMRRDRKSKECKRAMVQSPHTVHPETGLETMDLRCELPRDALLRPPYKNTTGPEIDPFCFLMEYRLSKSPLSQEAIERSVPAHLQRFAKHLLRVAPRFMSMREIHLVMDVDVTQILTYVEHHLHYHAQEQGGGLKPDLHPARDLGVSLPEAFLRRVDRLASVVKVDHKHAETSASNKLCGTEVAVGYTTPMVRLEDAPITAKYEPLATQRAVALRQSYPGVAGEELRGYPEKVGHISALTVAAVEYGTARLEHMRRGPQSPLMAGMCHRLIGPEYASPDEPVPPPITREVVMVDPSADEEEDSMETYRPAYEHQDTPHKPRTGTREQRTQAPRDELDAIFE